MAEQLYRHVKVKTEQGILVVTITESKIQGDALAESLRDELLQAVAQAGTQKVVVDMHFMTYLSSAGFRPFLNLRSKLKESGGRMVLCQLGGAVEDAFRITRLISSSGSSAAPFEVKPDVAAAVASLQEGAAAPPASSTNSQSGKS